MTRSPYHLGFSTLDREINVEKLPVRGAIPSWLRGTLVRTGPARFEVGEQSYNHWFDGLAMVHKFTFSTERVSYANRYLRSRSYCEAIQKKRISRGEFATDPCRTLFGRVKALFSAQLTDNCNVNISQFAKKLVALTETRLPIRFDLDTLETLGVYAYEESIRGQLATAHPHFDIERSCLYNYFLEFGRKSAYRLYSIDMETGRHELVATIPIDNPAYMHSFAMTTRYLVLAEFPLVVNPLRLRFSGKPFIENYRWEPQRGVRFHVIDKAQGKIVKTAQGAPCFAFHHVNAFEEREAITVDMVIYPDPAVINDLYLERLRSNEPVSPAGKLTRFRIDMTADKHVLHEAISETSIELPRINYARRVGMAYRYVYGTGNEVPGNFVDKLVKLDLENGQALSWYEDGCYPGEPVFVGAPEASEEDQGVILSVVLDAHKQTSFLLVLAASNYAELARAEVPHPIPFGFHGNYLANEGAHSPADLHREV